MKTAVKNSRESGAGFAVFGRHLHLFRKSWGKYWELYLCLIPVILYFVIFHYWPMYGVQIAFKDFNPVLGVSDSPWAGLKHFARFFNSYYFGRLIKNTLSISLYQLLVSTPAPIILAIMMNELVSLRAKKTMQLITYAPHFLSVVVVVSILTNLLSPRTGLVNHALMAMGLDPVFFIAEPGYFSSIYVWSTVWQSTGWNSIIYIAAIAGIDPTLYEAAIVDGASKLKRIWHITLPSILPTMVILLIMNSGKVMSVGYQKVFLMQNTLNLEASEIISTYVYKSGLVNAQFSFASAIDLFNSVINCILLFMVNKISKAVGETSLF